MKIKFTQSAAQLLAISSLLLSACGGPMANGDASTNTDARAVADTGVGGGSDAARADSGGMMNNDRCAAEQAMAAAGVGCNGGFVTMEPAANAVGGTCMVDAMNEQGSCTDPTAFCVPSAMGSMTGRCGRECTPGGTYVSTGGCPTGFRCFDLGMGGACFRDCNAAHMCPMGMMCDNEGSCVGM